MSEGIRRLPTTAEMERAGTVVSARPGRSRGAEMAARNGEIRSLVRSGLSHASVARRFRLSRPYVSQIVARGRQAS